jgi:hypothetical protein
MEWNDLNNGKVPSDLNLGTLGAFIGQVGSRDSSVGIATGYGLDDRGGEFESR